MSILDFLVPLITIAVLVMIGSILKQRFLRYSNLRKYFIPALLSKIFGAITVGLIYTYYYGREGMWDTFNFYNIGTVILNGFDYSFDIGMELLNLEAGDYSKKHLQYHISGFYSWYFKEDSAFFVGKISGVIGAFTNNSYMAIACIFGFFAFIGNWCIFITSCKAFPQYSSKLVIPIFYIPSVVFWGSGLFKDTIALGALGILIYASYSVIIERKNYVANIILIIGTSYIIYRVKDYILLCFIPSIMMMTLQHYRNRINNSFIRIFIKPLLLIIIFFSLITYLPNAIVQNTQVNTTINEIVEMQEWHAKVSSEGSVYSLGEYSPTILGISSKIIPAINVTFFRPYIWESRDAIMLFASVESFFILVIFLLFILRTKIKSIYNIIMENSFLLFMIMFSLILAFVVGFTSYNFGALVRYKIPSLPFFLSSIILIKNIHTERIREQS